MSDGRRAPAPFELTAHGTGLPPYRGARVLVTFVVNIEHWSLDKPMPRAALPAPHGMSVVPDVANHSWVLYGLRVGLARVVKALQPLGDRVTVALNSSAVVEYPAAIDLIERQGWEIVGHGVRQESVQSVADEETAVSGAIAQLRQRFGVAPRGWLSPGMNQTDDTLRLQRAHGIEFTHDWMIDDRPVWLETGGEPMLGLPYTLENNDVTVYQIQHQPDGSFLKRVERTLDRLSQESIDGTVVLPIGLHPHIVGVAHRIAEIEQIVDLIVRSPQCRAVTSSELADWYRTEVPI
ncbi:polysaccharide deacetylase family protein [Microbacterium sp. NPDC076911]|uniref:polysaccharide deacetylase family protein n=1 Tax=Microbacterium sp. NPDC076911 TaxID=3154958 RepID=UPI003418668E